MDLDQLRQQIDAEPIGSPEEAEAFRIKYLGRKGGMLNDLFGRIKDVPPAERKTFGQEVNALKQRAQARVDEAEAAFAAAAQADAPRLDLTLPGRTPWAGSLHPLTQTLEEIKAVFGHFGFEVAEGPEVETDWYNFGALNFPPDHPARDMQDTFFVEPSGEDGTGGVVLRTHTSPVQIRTMEEREPPIRIIAPGRVYRNEAISYKSFCLFHQVEGLYIDEDVTMADLKQQIHVFAQHMFGADVKMRFRPSFFPFTEPSAEVDIWWADEAKPGGGQWMEIMGCGMVDPNVLASADVDPERYSGYAFGMGVERIAMLRHDISDIRLFYENDARFLAQF